MNEEKIGYLFERLRTIIDTYEGGVQADFSERTGIPPGSLVDYLRESGEHKFKYPHFIRVIKAYPKISPAWLLAGEGEMLRGAAPAGEPATDPAQTAFEREILTLEQTLRRANASDETIQRAILARVGATPPSRYPVAGEDQTEIRATDGPPAVHES